MNLFFKIFIFFCNFNIFCASCSYNNKTKNNNEINDDDKEINNDNNDDKPPADDYIDKKPPVDNKNRRDSYFRWDNGNCCFQVFCFTFIMIFRDNPEGLKLLEDSNILFFQKVAQMVKNYINYKKKRIKGDSLKDLQEVFKEYCRLLVNESLIIVDKMLKILNDNDLNFNTLNKIYCSTNQERKNYDNNLVKIVEELDSYFGKFDDYLVLINYFGANDNYNLNKAKSYNLNFNVGRSEEDTDEDYKLRVKRYNEFIADFYELQDNLFYLKEFLNYYKNDFTKDLLETIKNPKSYGFAFHISTIFLLLKKYIPNITNNEKFKNLDFGNDNKNINEKTIFIQLLCCSEYNESKNSDHASCIYKDINGNYWYANSNNIEFLIDKNLIKQKKFKEIVANNFGGYRYTLHSVDDFINLKN